jgi:hypothetical protein
VAFNGTACDLLFLVRGTRITRFIQSIQVSLKNFTLQAGFETANPCAMHQLKNALSTPRSLSTVLCATLFT